MADLQTILQLFRTGHELNHIQWMEVRHTVHDGPYCIVATRYSCNYSYRDHMDECGDNTDHEISQCVHYDGQNLPFYEHVDGLPRSTSNYQPDAWDEDNEESDEESDEEENA